MWTFEIKVQFWAFKSPYLLVGSSFCEVFFNFFCFSNMNYTLSTIKTF
jgi:hypothetical protein